MSLLVPVHDDKYGAIAGGSRFQGATELTHG
jgi:hypothetical protein